MKNYFDYLKHLEDIDNEYYSDYETTEQNEKKRLIEWLNKNNLNKKYLTNIITYVNTIIENPTTSDYNYYLNLI